MKAKAHVDRFSQYVSTLKREISEDEKLLILTTHCVNCRKRGGVDHRTGWVRTAKDEFLWWHLSVRHGFAGCKSKFPVFV